MLSIWKFIIKFHVSIFFVILEIFAFLMIISYNKNKEAIFLHSANAFTGYIYKWLNPVFSYFAVKEENKFLIEENAWLKNVLYTFQRFDTAKFRTFQDTAHQQQYLYKTAKIIYNSISHTNNYLTIDKGRKQGIEKDMGVMSVQGIVGIVVDVSDNFSLVLSVLNSKGGISAKIRNNNYFGSVTWDAKDYRYVKLNEIPNHVPVKIGDSIVTSGYSHIFPQGLPIGVITRFFKKGNDNFYDITLKLFSDLKAADNVYVIKNIFQQEQQQLLKKVKNVQ